MSSRPNIHGYAWCARWIPVSTRGWIEAVIQAVGARDRAGLVDLICAAVPEFTPSDLVLPTGTRTPDGYAGFR